MVVEDDTNGDEHRLGRCSAYAECDQRRLIINRFLNSAVRCAYKIISIPLYTPYKLLPHHELEIPDVRDCTFDVDKMSIAFSMGSYW